MIGAVIITLIVTGGVVMTGGLIRDCWYLRRATGPVPVVPGSDQPADAPADAHVDSHGGVG